MTQPGTVFDALLASAQKATDFNHDDMTSPAAVLWTDEKREWERLVPRLRAAWPHFFTLGSFDKVNRSGPAIWLRCVLAGKVPDLAVPTGTVPVIYMPGVSRSTLRATEECPADLKPIAELQYRGVFWSQLNGKDWTVTGFLQSGNGGLELTIARDAATATSIRRAIEHLAGVPVADLKAKSASGELSSPYFDGLVVEDFVDDLLCWLSDPKGTMERWEASRWETLCSRCPTDYGFDPARDGELVGAEKLGLHEKVAWKTAWKRFATGPDRYPGLTNLLRQAKPKPKKGPGLFDSQESEAWPQDNEVGEAELRQALLDLTTSPVPEARKRIAELEANHAPRREWVWAKLGRSPLAYAVRHLATLADATKAALGGATAADMVRTYAEGGWRADAAMLDAIASVTIPQDRDAVCATVAHVYQPWLRDGAEVFQQRVMTEPLPGSSVRRLGDVPSSTCVLFADGLRYDLGEKLRAALSGRVGQVAMTHHYAALPSVTPTAKPAVSPVAGKIGGSVAGLDFLPAVALDGKELTTDRFRKLLDDAGYQVLGLAEVGDPSGKSWTEYGNVDRTGHDEGINLARRIPELIDNLVLRIEALLAAGWREVRVVTDHGWLLMPGGLPKVELPKYLTATRWRRCAVVKSSSTVEQPTFSWFWAEDVRIACPQGIGVFMSGVEYDHGGLSLQECVVPQLSIQAGTTPVVSAKIESVKWVRLRCRIELSGSFAGCKIDLRDKPADPTTSLAAAKPAGPDGSVAVVVTDDTREGSATTLVLLDPSGHVIEKTPVTVGG
ncbi:MAG: BREX-1 system phosphatase PglZ type B [Planctomycetaceae bacterium]|nr:BREX-1 system phosphatase PglZ type B [Planctomycetaceae bacterium]